jgi:uncharacterized membrane protein YkvA (DUF1232 family)
MRYLPWLLALLYFVVPHDAVPDFMLGPGWLDDLGILALAWWWAARLKKMRQTGAGPEAYQRGQGGPSTGKRGPGTEDFEETDPHTLLGVAKDASREEIKAAYKKMAALYHPDKVQHLGKEFQEMAHKKFVAIQRAYDMLMK